MQFLRAVRPRAASRVASLSLPQKVARGICIFNSSVSIRPSSPSGLSRIRLYPLSVSRGASMLQTEPISSSKDVECHAPNCTCQDPNARLTKSTLEKLLEFTRNLDPAFSTDADMTFLLQYLEWSEDLIGDDVAGARTLEQRHARAIPCPNNLAHRHAQATIGGLARILAAQRPSDPRHSQRVVQAWSDIERWISYTAYRWSISGQETISPEGQQAQDRIDSFNTIIPFLSIAVKLPEIMDLLLADELSRNSILNILVFSWLNERDEWFMNEHGYDPSISTADPLATIVLNTMESQLGPDFDRFGPNVALLPSRSFIPGFDWLNTFETVRNAMNRDPTDVARTALTLLRHRPISLNLLHAHLEMTNLLVFAFDDTLLAQNSIGAMTRVLSELSLRPHEPDFAPIMGKCITKCVGYLILFIQMKDSFSHTRITLLGGVIPAILRCGPWFGQDSSEYAGLVALLEVISLYLIFPSVLRPFLISARKIEKLGLVGGNRPLGAAYLKLVKLVDDRLALVQPPDGQNLDLSVKCKNCGKHDTDANFKACSGCFLPSYCSEDCQKADWRKHERECKAAEALREEGKPLPMLPEDSAYLSQFAMAQVNRHRAEIVRVWIEEGPTRAPLVSFDFSLDPEGVMVTGKQCFESTPEKAARPALFAAEAGAADAAESAYFMARWAEMMVRPEHYDVAIVGMFTPLGERLQETWVSIGIKEELRDGEGTVWDKLVKTVEGGFECGLSGAPIIESDISQSPIL
ncbi:hypothetical protein B0H17DRAFT_1326437 [Mycena rosella]|uniref:MYND-type domain-containing protein n=1 Tax=Mycena rosella TaxID=1033263 RepID=A0AAD7GTQ5_MYCRO|nr:hypothetical protein B0H17DRAFT_1326437 [Mycena rosella]